MACHDVPFLRLSGDLIFGHNLRALHDATAKLRASGHTIIAIDLTDIGAVDSTGIGALLDVRRMIGMTGCVVLLRASAHLRTSLDVMRVTKLFTLEDEEAGVLRVVAQHHDATA